MSVPDSVKDTISKTVAYVLKNGPTFEERLLKDAPEKFLFLQSSDEHHQFYQLLLREAQLSHSGTKQDGSTNSAPKNDKNLPKPPAYRFLTILPPITPEDLEVIKLAALFVAVNGRKYQEKLLERGPRAQFEFLKPGHSLNSVYETYLGQYEIIIGGNEDPTQEVSSDVIKNAYNRAQYEKTHRSQQKQDMKNKKAKQIAYASIDWQDFAIVGSIKFDEIDEVKELATPLKRNDLIYRTLESKQSKEPSGVVVKGEHTEKVVESENPPPAIAGMKIKAVGESRLKRKKQQQTESMIKCPITGKLIPELQFDDHLKALLRDPRYEEQRENYKRKNFGYESNITTDQVYENIKRMTDKRAGIKKLKTME